jgi:outer membrane beta-barrel protein
VGARYASYSNSLTSEGKSVYNDASQRIQNGEQGVRVPGIAYAKDSWLGVINFYPIYGKLNLFDAGVSQFDVYVLAGAGQINLDTGSAPMYSAGGGVGFWWSKHFSTRVEARWQGYRERVNVGGGEFASRDMNETVLGVSVGFIL